MGTKSLQHPALRGRRGCYLSLACSIGSISIACGSLLQIQNSTDRISLQRGLFLTSMGFIYFVSLTDFFNKYLLETPQGIKFRKKYRLMMSDVMEITNKIVSAVQAAFSCLAGFIVCKSTCSKSFVYASHFFMEAYAWFGTAYFMYDIWSMYKVHTQKISDKLKLMKLTSNPAFTPSPTLSHTTNGLYDKHIAANAKKSFAASSNSSTTPSPTASPIDETSPLFHKRHHEDEIYDYDGEPIQIPEGGNWDFLKYVITHPVMMIHHVFIGTFGLLVVTYIRGGGHCIYSYMFMMEFSTPFVSLRSILSTLGMKNSRAYIANGLVMLGSFFLCRIVMWPYVFYKYSEVINSTFIDSIATLPRGCIISVLILFLPQVYWFFLMLKGALKVFLPSKSKSFPITKHKESKNNNLSPMTEDSQQFLSPPILKNGNLSKLNTTTTSTKSTTGIDLTSTTNGKN
ncbi:uncharacterized protein LOC129941512 [Eupeodes corollae]|uniref:uncharacterized protein LOC129941512 n=1 Tax=Eupeodes corollae TaxID=290404 RepID=UPI0024903F07|nr:uncharacterized protein LOC129941512 [Eupeodes corollae]